MITPNAMRDAHPTTSAAHQVTSSGPLFTAATSSDASFRVIPSPLTPLESVPGANPQGGANAVSGSLREPGGASLPSAAPAKQQAATSAVPAVETSLRNPTESDASETQAAILLVDDREDKALAMVTVMESLEQTIVRASSGREALRCLLRQEFAVILLDVNMPGMDGFETAHLIRQRRQSEKVPIIFVTDISTQENHVSRGYSLGAVDYILTPVVPEVLRAKVSVFVELYKATAEVKRQAERLKRAYDELETRVQQRTAELAELNLSLKAEVADRQKAEEKILKLNRELEARVLERTTELREANEELQTFTYTVAHDLRAPLRQIHGFAQIVEQELQTLDIAKDVRQYARRIGERGQAMGQMVDDLLHLSQIARQEFPLQDVDLEKTVQEALRDLQHETTNRRIEWLVGPLPRAQANPGLIKQVFTNLLSNAIKYTRDRDVAKVEIGQFINEGEEIYFVRDNGVGFDMKYADKLFGVFQRLHLSSEFEGTGVGLAIVDRIVRKHGGRTWATAADGKGATFFFTLKNKVES